MVPRHNKKKVKKERVEEERERERKRERERVKNRTVQKKRERNVTSGSYCKTVVQRIFPDSSHQFASTKPSNARPQRKKTQKKSRTRTFRLRETRDFAKARNALRCEIPMRPTVLKYRKRSLSYYVSKVAEHVNGAEERFASETPCLLLVRFLSPRDSKPLAVSLRLHRERRLLTCVRLLLCVRGWWCWWFTTRDAEDSPDSQPSSSPVVSHSLLSASLDSLGVSCPPIPSCTLSPPLFVVAGTSGDMFPPTLCINRLTCN